MQNSSVRKSCVAVYQILRGLVDICFKEGCQWKNLKEEINRIDTKIILNGGKELVKVLFISHGLIVESLKLRAEKGVCGPRLIHNYTTMDAILEDHYIPLLL